MLKDIKVQKTTTYRIGSTDRYFNDLTYQSKLISIDKEIELFKRFQAGDEEALNQILIANLRFVVTVAKQFAKAGDGDNLMDLIQEGNLGMIHAAKTFDITTGFKFISYAVWHIRQKIMLYTHTLNDTVRLSGNVSSDKTRLGRLKDELETKLERLPNEDEMIQAYKNSIQNTKLKYSHEQIKEKVKYFLRGYGYVFIDNHAVNHDDGSVFISDTMIDESSENINNYINKDHQNNLIKKLLQILNPKEKEIIELFYGINDCEQKNGGELITIAEKMNLAPERIRQIKKMALVKMQNAAKSKNLKTY